MCVGDTHSLHSYAGTYFEEAQKALNMRQYQKALDRLDKAAQELDGQRKGLRKFLEKELADKELRFQATAENLAKLKRLNDQLAVIQNEANREAGRLKAALKTRLRQQEDFLTDYEIEIDMDFYLRDDDPEYRQDEDSILATLSCGDYIGIEDQEDLDYGDGPMKGILPTAHCCLFHSLYDHISPKNLHWSDLLRIGSVWVDIKVSYQKKYGLKAGQLIRDNWISPEDQGVHYKLRQ